MACVLKNKILLALLISILVALMIGCEGEKEWEVFELKTIDIEDHSEVNVKGSFFLIWGSYKETNKSGFRYIFLANNGIDGSWIINDIVDFRDDDRITVSIQYVELESEQKLLRHVNTTPDSYDYGGYKAYYILYLTEENIINLLNSL